MTRYRGSALALSTFPARAAVIASSIPFAVKTRQNKTDAIWGKVRRALNALRALALRALDALAPPRAGSRSLRTITAEMLFARSERARELQNGVEALFAYRDPLVRGLIWEMKYRLSARAITIVAECLAAHLAEEISERTLFDALSRPMLISIPASPTRATERGGDPLALVATRATALLNGLCSHAPNTLYKIRDTKPQTTLKHRAERLHNVVGSFALRDSASVRGRDVIVLDDVTTTGATFAEARRALQAAGARRIICIALAH